MMVLFGLIIISLLLAGGFLIAFFWAVKNGQYDDDYTPSVRMLFDDDPENQPEENGSRDHFTRDNGNTNKK